VPGDEVADVVADPLWVHDRRPAAERWSTKGGEYLPIELGLVVSHVWSQFASECQGGRCGLPVCHVTRLAIRIQ
jgi:hypothetical protein